MNYPFYTQYNISKYTHKLVNIESIYTFAFRFTGTYLVYSIFLVFDLFHFFILLRVTYFINLHLTNLFSMDTYLICNIHLHFYQIKNYWLDSIPYLFKAEILFSCLLFFFHYQYVNPNASFHLFHLNDLCIFIYAKISKQTRCFSYTFDI